MSIPLQTTIIWDAHTGEAKQQFPFHSGEDHSQPDTAAISKHSVSDSHYNSTGHGIFFLKAFI